MDGAGVEGQIELKTESAVNMQDVGAGNHVDQIEQLVRSIRLEAAEISVSSEEELRLDPKQKNRQDGEPCEKLVGLLDKLKKLDSLGLSLASALLHLDLELLADAVQPMVEAANQFIRSHYNDITKCSELTCESPSEMCRAGVEKQIELKTESPVNMQDVGAGNQVDQIEQLVRAIRLEVEEISVSSEEDFNVDRKQKKIRQDGEPCEKLVGLLDKLKKLDSLGLSLDSALLYLDLQSNELLADAVQPMVEAANQFIRSRYYDITKCPEEVLGLPLAGFESVLACDDLRVPTEDNVLDLALNYLQKHYPSLEERENVLMTRLIHLLRFQYLRRRKLMTTTNCLGFNSGAIAKVVIDNLDRKQAPRAYTVIPVEVIQCMLPKPRCDVYMRLSRDQCANLFPSGRVASKTFIFNGRKFALYAECNLNSKKSPCLGLSLWMREKESEICEIQWRFSVIANRHEEFEEKCRGTHKLRGGRSIGVRNLLRLPWARFIAADSKYFVSNFLHLKADVMFVRSI